MLWQKQNKTKDDSKTTVERSNLSFPIIDYENNNNNSNGQTNISDDNKQYRQHNKITSKTMLSATPTKNNAFRRLLMIT